MVFVVFDTVLDTKLLINLKYRLKLRQIKFFDCKIRLYLQMNLFIQAMSGNYGVYIAL